MGDDGLGWKDEVGNLMRTVSLDCGEDSITLAEYIL